MSIICRLGPFLILPEATEVSQTDRDSPGAFIAAPIPDSILASQQQSKMERTSSRPVLIQIAEDPEGQERQAVLVQPAAPQVGHSNSSINSAISHLVTDKENVPVEIEHGLQTPGVAPKPKRRPKKRKSIGQQSGRKRKRISTSSTATSNEGPLVETNDIIARSPERESQPQVSSADESALPLTGSEPQQIPTIAKKRKNRKSVNLRPKSRRRSQKDLRPDGIFADNGEEHEISISSVSVAETPLIEVDNSQIGISRSRKRRVSDASELQTPANIRLDEMDLEGDETYVDEELSPEKPTPRRPSKKKQSKASKSRRASMRTGPELTGSGRSMSPGRKVPPKNSFPILTHRFANLSSLPTVAEEFDCDSDGNQTVNNNSLASKLSNRAIPNAIDILAQFCRETVSKLSDASCARTANNKEIKQKHTVIEAFGSELDSRLFDMSAAVEHKLNLEDRVKKSRKERTELQAQWMEIRRQREEVSLKCDDIRRRHWENESVGDDSHQLSEKIWELEMELERRKPSERKEQGEGLDFMLKRVAASVCSSSGGGLLNRVKEFNSLLERTAFELESRRAS